MRIQNRSMRILDRLPLYDKPAILSVGQGEVTHFKRNQIIVWVSIGETLRPFPAILHTGCFVIPISPKPTRVRAEG